LNDLNSPLNRNGGKPGGEVAGMAAGAREWNSAEMRALLETLLPVAH
jgi:hypothetical protein